MQVRASIHPAFNVEWAFEVVDRSGNQVVAIHGTSSENPLGPIVYGMGREEAFARAENAAMRRIEAAVQQSRVVDDEAP